MAPDEADEGTEGGSSIGPNPWIGRSRRPEDPLPEGVPTHEPVGSPDADEPPDRPDLITAPEEPETDGPRAEVWMVSVRTGLEGRKGTLSIERGTLAFRPESRSFGDTRIPLGDISRVRRAMVTPILDVRLRSGSLPERMGFYFVEPPSLDTPEGFHINPRRSARRKAANKLRSANRELRVEVEEWVRRIESERR